MGVFNRDRGLEDDNLTAPSVDYEYDNLTAPSVDYDYGNTTRIVDHQRYTAGLHTRHGSTLETLSLRSGQAPDR
ncbi:hypothetical protein E2P81_ATG04315 [Venturia nashicola]|nr:hypothetical protein E2P81_ATG04315 [Venturia nashicola]